MAGRSSLGWQVAGGLVLGILALVIITALLKVLLVIVALIILCVAIAALLRFIQPKGEGGTLSARWDTRPAGARRRLRRRGA